MKRKLILCFLAVVVAMLAAPAAWGQLATFKGRASDSEGKPIAGAQVQITSQDTGRKYDLKTDKGGNFYSLGIQPGIYVLKLSKDGQLLYTSGKIQITLAGTADNATTFNVDLKKEEQASGITEEKKKEVEQAQNTAVANATGAIVAGVARPR